MFESERRHFNPWANTTHSNRKRKYNTLKNANGSVGVDCPSVQSEDRDTRRAARSQRAFLLGQI
jgi:hypothetical protein